MNNSPQEFGEKTIKVISNKYHLDGLYYGMDNHNIFKRVDRYQQKTFLTIVFSFLSVINLFEIIFNFLFLCVIKKNSDNFSKIERILTSLISLVNIVLIILLSSVTIIKLKIRSSIFY